jgi:hypothetical protein
VIAAFDFSTVPSLSFRTLYSFFVTAHGRRRILAFNCAAHPTADWIVQQLRFAFSDPFPYRYVAFDRNAKFGKDVVEFLRSAGLRVLRGSIQCAWQSGNAERWVGSARRDVMVQVIPLKELHLRRTARRYVNFSYTASAWSWRNPHRTIDQWKPEVATQAKCHPIRALVASIAAAASLGQPERFFESTTLRSPMESIPRVI